MSQLAHIERAFPWGVLLVKDSDTEEVPRDFDHDGLPITSTKTTAAIGVRVDVDGPVAVTVWDSPINREGIVLPVVALDFPTGVARIGDVLDDDFVDVSLKTGRYLLTTVLDNEDDATRVDLILTPDTNPTDTQRE